MRLLVGMDSDFLDDLLECSVCLRPLDQHNKVLPCQHTFCQSCLESIVQSHKSLRCPECRMLVEKSVKDLPTNIMLVRLLDGLHSKDIMKEQSRKEPKSLKNSKHRDNNAGESHQSRLANSTRQIKDIPANIPHGKAIRTHRSSLPGHLNFNSGDIIVLHKQLKDDWFSGECKGQHGIFPSHFVQTIYPLQQMQAMCTAIHDFKKSNLNSDDRDCLTFEKNDRILMIRPIDDNWAEGRLNSRIGIFPLNFVTLSYDAQKILEEYKQSNRKYLHDNHSRKKESSCNSKLAHVSNKQPSRPSNQAKQERVTPTGNKVKDLGSVNPSGKSLSLPTPPRYQNRLAAKLPTTKVTSSVAAAGNGQQKKDIANPAMHGVHAVKKISPSHSNKGSIVPNDESLNYVIAVYAYKPKKQDELELTKGERYRITEVCNDGWCRGVSSITKKSGVFPGNYTKPIGPGSGSLYKAAPRHWASPKSPHKHNQQRRWSAQDCNSSESSKPPSVPRSVSSPNHLAPSSNPHSANQRLIQSLMRDTRLQEAYISYKNLLENGDVNFISPENKKLEPDSKSSEIEVRSDPAQIQDLKKKKDKTGNDGFIKKITSTKKLKSREDEKFRAVMPYPASGPGELELKPGDVVMVQKVQQDGWYRGFDIKSGKAGMFPGIFVEKF